MPPPIPRPGDKSGKKKSSDQITSSPKKSPPRDVDDDEDGDRPAIKRPEKEGSNTMLMVGGLIGAGVLLLFCCGGIGVGGFFFWKTDPVAPQKDEPPIVVKGPQKDEKDGGKDGPPKDGFRDGLFNDGGPRDGGLKDKPPPPPRDNIKPPPPPPPPANLVADAKLKLLIDADSAVKNMAFCEQAPRAALFYWDGKQNLAKTIDVWDYQAGKRISRITTSDDPGLMHLSPAGTRILLRKVFPPRLDLWSVNDSKQIIKDWDPYPKDPKKFVAGQELVWGYLLSDDRVLTVARSGQFDLWNLTNNQRVYGVPAPMPSRFMQDNPFAKAPQEWALSLDRKYFAITNKDGFNLYEAATGKYLAKTDSFAAEGAIGNQWSVAFNRAGTLLAFRGNLFIGGNKNQEVITVWDVPSGKRRWHYNIAQDFSITGPMNFIGDKYLMVHDGTVTRGTLFGLTDGRLHRQCVTSARIGDRFGIGTPDDRLWYVSRVVGNAPGFLVAVDFPEADLTRNPAPKVNLTRQLPQWGCFPTMIQRMNPGEL